MLLSNLNSASLILPCSWQLVSGCWTFPLSWIYLVAISGLYLLCFRAVERGLTLCYFSIEMWDLGVKRRWRSKGLKERLFAYCISACFWLRLWLWGSCAELQCRQCSEITLKSTRIEWVTKQGLSAWLSAQFSFFLLPPNALGRTATWLPGSR